jgi:hypothetical protein
MYVLMYVGANFNASFTKGRDKRNLSTSVNNQSVPPSFLVRWNVREAVPAPMDDDPHTLIGLQADPYLLRLSKC